MACVVNRGAEGVYGASVGVGDEEVQHVVLMPVGGKSEVYDAALAG